MRCFISNLLVQTLFLSSAIAASAKTNRPFPALSNSLAQQALEVRGGWTRVDTAKGITKLGLAVGTTTALSSKSVLDKSGIGNVDPLCLLVTRRIGVAILSFSIASYFLLCQNTNAFTAVGFSGLPIVLELFKTLFDGTHIELGFPAAGQAIVLVITCIFSFSFLNETPLSKDTLLKIHSGWTVLNGILMGCFPNLACKAWGRMDDTISSVFQRYVSLWGFSLLSLGTLSGCLAASMTTNKALAFGSLPFLSRFVLSKFL